jgi:hypothetical protein
VLLALAVAMPANAFAGPAVDEYTLDVPNAKGKRNSGSDTPTTNPGALPDGVAAQLRKDPDGRALATIASAPELGAPKVGDVTSGESGEDPSALSAALSGITDPASLAILIALCAIGGAFFAFRNRRDVED